MFCPQCRSEYRESFANCSSCNVPLVEALEPLSLYDATSRLPSLWIGFLLACLFFVVEIGEVVLDPTSADRVTVLPVLVGICGSVYWLFCVHRFHKVLAEVTAGKYPITPGASVGFHFLPFYNLYWIFRWPNTLTRFVNERTSQSTMTVGVAGGLLLAGLLVGRVFDGAFGLAIMFSAGIYLRNGLRRMLAMHTSKITTADA